MSRQRSPAALVAGRCHRDERGAGTVLMMAVMLITAMVAFVVACVTAWFGCVHQARAAADLAALAGADAYGHGQNACQTAAGTAAANGATLTTCGVDTNGRDFIVRVTVQVAASPHTVFGPSVFTQESEAGNVT